jgi:hypothetical protein
VVVVPVRNEIGGKLHQHRSLGITVVVAEPDREEVSGMNRVCGYLSGTSAPERCKQPQLIFTHCVIYGGILRQNRLVRYWLVPVISVMGTF